MFRLPVNHCYHCLFKGSLHRQCQRRLYRKGVVPLQAGFGKVFVFFAPIAAVGGVITYANHDKEFRKTIETTVPGSSKLLKIALQEEKPFQGLIKNLESVSNQISDVKSSVGGVFGSSGEKKTQKSEPTVAPTVKPVIETKPISHTPKPSPPPAAAKDSAVPVKPVSTLPADIIGLEKEIELAASLAIQEYDKAIKTLESYNKEVQNIVDKAVDEVELTAWISLKNKTSARDSAVQNAEKLAREAVQKVEKCEIALSKVADASNHDQVQAIRNRIKTFADHISVSKDELYRMKDLSSVSEKYWKKVEAARNYFVDQIESIFPDVKLNEKKLNIPKEDIDLFIMHAYSHVQMYQKELQRLQTEGELRLKRAIDAHPGEDHSEALTAQLQFHLEKERRQLMIENQTKIFQIRAEAEKQLRKQLKQQAEAHTDHLNDALSLKEVELRRNFSRELDEKLAAEKASYKLQLASMLGKLRGMDAALKARVESERSAHQAQALWAACQALWATVRTGEPGIHWRQKLRPLSSEINAVSKVSEGDELVNVVLQSLPKDVENRGVFPEDALRERFLNVERVARKVALVPEGGARLPVYLLSLVQSWFILRPDDPISKEELEENTFDFSKLDTYDILNRARYFVDRGDLLKALKYMNLLQGAPRKVARDWMNETRLLLETQQAANTLMAHAAASGLLYL